MASLVVAAAGLLVVVGRAPGTAGAPPADPLAAQERQALLQLRPLVDELPRAVSEVPQAAADAAGGRTTPAAVSARLARVPALLALSRAVAAPGTVTSPLVASFHAVLDGRPPADPQRLAAALGLLQSVEGDILPGVRVAAAAAGHPLSAARAAAAVDGDVRVRALADLLAGWEQLYGAFTLVEERSAAVS